MNIGSTTGSVMTTSSQSLVQSTEQVQKAVQNVVDATSERPVGETEKLTEAMVDVKQGQQEVDANAKLVKAADDNLGTLLDIKA